MNSLEADDQPVKEEVTLRELGTPQGGTLGSSNGKILMVLAFLAVAGLGCAAILLVPGFARRWRALDDVDRAHDQAFAESYQASVVDHQAPAQHGDGYEAKHLEGEGIEPLARHPAQHLG